MFAKTTSFLLSFTHLLFKAQHLGAAAVSFCNLRGLAAVKNRLRGTGTCWGLKNVAAL